jgi:hypothetical protein
MARQAKGKNKEEKRCVVIIHNIIKYYPHQKCRKPKSGKTTFPLANNVAVPHAKTGVQMTSEMRVCVCVCDLFFFLFFLFFLMTFLYLCIVCRLYRCRRLWRMRSTRQEWERRVHPWYHASDDRFTRPCIVVTPPFLVILHRRPVNATIVRIVRYLCQNLGTSS